MSTTAVHPLQQTFDRVTRLGGDVYARVGRQVGEGWVVPTALFAEGSSLLARLIDDERQRLRTTTPNVIGSSLFQNYQWPVIGALLAAYLIDRRVPEMTPDSVQLWFSPSGYAQSIAFTGGRFLALASDPLANYPAATTVPDRATLLNQARVALEAHLGWVIDQICRAVGCRSRGLWLAAADRCASTLAWLIQAQDPRPLFPQIGAEVEALIRVPGSPLYNTKAGIIEVAFSDRRELFFERVTCCYWYKCEGGSYCSTCPGRPRAQRGQQRRKAIASKATPPAPT